MPNSYFTYKQFTVHQDRCAMKVCTDSSLFGALIDSASATSILDIGTGTGLLALMQAQKSNAMIHAVEIDPEAAEQAKTNFSESKWTDRLTVHQTDVQNFDASFNNSFDLILSNPPFFKKNFKSSDRKINVARHEDGLSLDELNRQVKRLLHKNGTFWILLPEYQFSVFEQIAENWLHCNFRFNVKNMDNTQKLRVIGVFSRNRSPKIPEQDVVVKNRDNSYTDQFKGILKDFYLPF